ncbi:MAG: AraC family transcriptional regulator [Pseudacidovorax sp.]|nr:AraC family transcriptional regulator [Pseudacidovorax sp.]
MSFLMFRRGMAGVRLLLGYGAAQKLPVAGLLKGSGIDDALLTDPDAELDAAQELRVAANLFRLLGRPPGLGLTLGLRFRLGNFGLWGYGLMSSPTVGDALQMALRYLPLTYAFSAIGMHVGPDAVELHFTEPDLPPGLGRMLVERDLAAAAMLVRQVGGEGLTLTRVALKALPGRAGVIPADVGDFGGARPDFKADRYLIAFDRRHLARPMPQADQATAALCERMCRALMDRRRSDVGTAALVRHHLLVLPPGTMPTLAHMAQLLNTSERTLKRRLHDEGTSFRELAGQAQAQRAATLARDARLSLTEVAERMGYADLSAFSQAFKRWHGVAPDRFRRNAQ